MIGKPFLEEDLSPGSLAKELCHLLLGESHQNVQNPKERKKKHERLEMKEVQPLSNSAYLKILNFGINLCIVEILRSKKFSKLQITGKPGLR